MSKMIWGVALAGMAALGVAGNVQAQDYCREYQQKVTVGGIVRDSYGTACMQRDGSWQVQGGDADWAAASVENDFASVAPMAGYVVQEPVVYQTYREPIYTSYSRQSYYSTPSVGLSFGWSDRDGGRGHGGGWHDGHGRGHGRHH